MIHIDYETRSLADLKKVGAFRYAADPSTEILCAALARDDEKPLMWVNPKFGVSEQGVDELLAEWLCGEQLIYAHNVQFEQSITEALGNSYFDHVPERRRWRCTAAMARKAALPSSLEKCAAVLGLAQQKDKRGSALIRKFSIPDSETGRFTDPQDDPVAFQQFLEYCRQDVVVEREIHKALKAFELRGLSLDTFLMDYDINARGLPVNVDALHHANELVRQATDKLTPEFREITGLNPTQTTAFLKWLQERGYAPDNLRAATVDEELEELEINDGPAAVVRALQIKKMLAYASVKKIPSMIACAGPRDNKVRGSILFHGAERTGRFAGRLVQPQNFKKPVKSLEDHTKDIYRMICEKASAEEIEMNYAPVIECVASCIRHFIQEPGETLLDVDYSAIEARITAWLAGEEWRMEVFNTHGRIYEASAAQMFKIPMSQVTKDLRQKGKVSELALGFQGGPNALIAMGALKMGIPEDDLQDIVTKWREASPNIVDLWWKCDTAVRNALACPGHRYAVNGKIGYTVAKAAGMKFLFCDLPSGRRLSYPDPRVEQSVKWAEDGEVKRLLKPTTEQIMHAKKVDPKAWVKDDVTYAGFPTGSAVWGRIASSPGKWVENAVQAVAADIMCHGCLNAERAGYETATLIHDEWLGYKRPGQSADELIALLTDLPAWADGLPIKAEGGEVPFYTKE